MQHLISITLSCEQLLLLLFFSLKVQWFINYIGTLMIIMTSYYCTRIFSPSLMQGYNNIVMRIINPHNHGSLSSVC